MAALITCRTCGVQVAANAMGCPACGAPTRAHRRSERMRLLVILIFFALALGAWVVYRIGTVS